MIQILEQQGVITVIQIGILYRKRLQKILRSIRKKLQANENIINEFGFIFLVIFMSFLEENLDYLSYLSYVLKYLHIS